MATEVFALQKTPSALLIIIVRKALVNKAKILHNIHGIYHSVCSLIYVGHNLHGQKDSTWQAKAMTQMFLYYYAITFLYTWSLYVVNLPVLINTWHLTKQISKLAVYEMY